MIIYGMINNVMSLVIHVDMIIIGSTYCVIKHAAVILMLSTNEKALFPPSIG